MILMGIGVDMSASETQSIDIPPKPMLLDGVRARIRVNARQLAYRAILHPLHRALHPVP